MFDNKIPLVFTPANEPYLGRELLVAFDNLICACMELNKDIAPSTHDMVKSDLQEAACLLIPQSLSIALSIRELVRQGYLFGAYVLVRTLAERAAILMYLNQKPSEVDKWNRGWQVHESPSLAKMLEDIGGTQGSGTGKSLLAPLNSLLHGKPDSSYASIVSLGETRFGHAVSKQLDSPLRCDEVCAQTLPWLCIVYAMMNAYFPKTQLPD